MILIGELETNNKMMLPDGYKGFLFAWTSPGTKMTDQKPIFHYAISPYPDKNSYHVGDLFHTNNNLSIEEFLQKLVDMDIEIGRNTAIRLGENLKVRLKGMTEWIERKDYSLDAPTH